MPLLAGWVEEGEDFETYIYNFAFWWFDLGLGIAADLRGIGRIALSDNRPNMRIVGVPTKTLSELARITLLSQFQALVIYRFYRGLGNRIKYISSLDTKIIS